MKILAHIPIANRGELFEEIYELFSGKDSKHSEFLNYYKKNWLNTYYVESMAIQNEGSTFLISRTNNICEVYNYLLNQKVGAISPRLSILISKLFNEEQNTREYLMKATVNASIKPLLPQGFLVNEEKLTIGSLTKLLEEKKPRYPLRSIIKDKEFEIECKRLVSMCYEALFLASIDEKDVSGESSQGEIQNQEEHEEALNSNSAENVYSALEVESGIEEDDVEADEVIISQKKSKR